MTTTESFVRNACWKCGKYRDNRELVDVPDEYGRTHKHCRQCADKAMQKAERKAQRG